MRRVFSGASCWVQDVFDGVGLEGEGGAIAVPFDLAEQPEPAVMGDPPFDNQAFYMGGIEVEAEPLPAEAVPRVEPLNLSS